MKMSLNETQPNMSKWKIAGPKKNRVVNPISFSRDAVDSIVDYAIDSTRDIAVRLTR